MGISENYSRILDENMALVESSLIANSNYRQHFKTELYPYNLTSPPFSMNTEAHAQYDIHGNGTSEGHFTSAEKQSRY